jgi:hypothetical protein
MYCARSPIRDCGCPPEEGFEDPFPDLPDKIDLTTATAYLAQLLRMGAASGASAEWEERLRIILVVSRLALLPEVEIMKPFVIMSMDVHIPEAPSAR